jgi:hypothetical protein
MSLSMIILHEEHSRILKDAFFLFIKLIESLNTSGSIFTISLDTTSSKHL